MISSNANCKQTVFESDSLPELLREIAEWLESNPVVWDILIEPSVDEYGIYFARVIEHDPAQRPTKDAPDLKRAVRKSKVLSSPAVLGG